MCLRYGKWHHQINEIRYILIETFINYHSFVVIKRLVCVKDNLTIMQVVVKIIGNNSAINVVCRENIHAFWVQQQQLIDGQ